MTVALIEMLRTLANQAEFNSGKRRIIHFDFLEFYV